MLQRINSDDHTLRGLYIVFSLADVVEGVPRIGFPGHPRPLQPVQEVILCDDSQLNEAVAIATGGPRPRIAQIVPLADMGKVAELLQHGLIASWKSAKKAA